MDERTDFSEGVPFSFDGAPPETEGWGESAIDAFKSSLPDDPSQALDLESSAGFVVQSAPDPSSRVITPSEVAIAYASGATAPTSTPSVIDPGSTNDFPIVAREDIQMPEMYADGEFPEYKEPIQDVPAAQEQTQFDMFVEPEPVVQRQAPIEIFEEPETIVQEQIAADSFEIHEPTVPQPTVPQQIPTDVPGYVSAPQAFVDPEPVVMDSVAYEEVSPIPQKIDEIAQAEAQEIYENSIAVAASDMLSNEEAFAATVTEEPIEVEEEPIERGITVITREATVLGDILTEGHIDIVGRVKGNIDAKGDVAIHGIVRGDVGGAKIGLYNCRVRGNLDAGLGVIVDDNSIIGGDVKTKNIIFDGKVKGNIDAENVVVLRSHSYCLGDVSAASLAIEPGAVLNGKVNTFVEGDLEAPFYEVI